MKLLADESIDRHIVERIRKEGHTIWAVAEMEPGISDDVVLDLANHYGALLLTADKDFGELIFRRQRISGGIVLVRLAGLSPARKAEIVAHAINSHSEDLPQAFSVITSGTIRIRRTDQ